MQLRRELRVRRRALTPAQRSAAGVALAGLIVGLPEFRDAEHIAVYMATDGEMDPAVAAAEARRAGKHLYLPLLAPNTPDALQFSVWQADTLLHPNRFRIPEPPFDPGKLRAPADLDLVFVPLVAFDVHGHRLGMGGGFYDRSFAFLISGARKPVLIGLAYEFQQLPALNAESWDVPLVGVVTERAVYRFPGRIIT
ncbi:MAG TPA: 5-formyltetrahydrofolate cyclo-ligase [Gammaproteobacteria bacterium]|nr:5-formyltetrahydrofolate cyclo-ligase [Gammaproteobacteria bacterium]